MTMRHLLPAMGMLAVLAGCQTTIPNDTLAYASFVCQHEPAAWALIVEVDRLTAAQMATLRSAHLTIEAVCNPLPTDVGTVIDALRRAWDVLSPAEQRAQSMRVRQ